MDFIRLPNADTSLESIDDVITLSSILGAEEAICKRLLLFFGVKVVQRSPTGYVASTEGTSSRTVYLVSEGNTIRGFILVTFNDTTPSSFIIPSYMEQPIEHLDTILNKPPTSCGHSSEVHSFRFHDGIYTKLLWCISQHTINGTLSMRHLNEAIDLICKSNMILPSNLAILNAIDPGWVRGDGPHRQSFIKHDVFDSCLTKETIARRRALLSRGKAIIDATEFSTRELLLIYLRTYCTSIHLGEYFDALEKAPLLLNPTDRYVDAIRESVTGQRKRKHLSIGTGSLKSAPKCVHDALKQPLVDSKRFDLARIVSHIIREHEQDPKSYLKSLMKEIIKHGTNTCRIEDIESRIHHAITSDQQYTDTFPCIRRTSNTYIACPFSGPDKCLAGRTNGHLMDPASITITTVWSSTTPAHPFKSRSPASSS